MIDRRGFETRVRAEDVSPDAFSIGEDKDEMYCVLPGVSGGYMVYYSERGHRRDEKTYSDEASALEDLLTRVLSDPTTRVAYRDTHRWPG